MHKAAGNCLVSSIQTLDYERAHWARSCLFVAGVDEVGRGCLAGPVVAAAVIFPPHVHVPGVNDSKKLSPKVREELLPQIITAALCYGIGLVESTEIDHINILQASRKAMAMAVQSLAQQPDVLLIDGRERLALEIPQETIIAGDAKCHAIAAASIIAKVTRDRLMHSFQRTFPNFRFAEHKGYGTRVHLEEIRQFGPTPIHRRSFRGVLV